MEEQGEVIGSGGASDAGDGELILEVASARVFPKKHPKQRKKDSKPNDGPDGQDSPELKNATVSMAVINDSNESRPAEGVE